MNKERYYEKIKFSDVPLNGSFLYAGRTLKKISSAYADADQGDSYLFDGSDWVGELDIQPILDSDGTIFTPQMIGDGLQQNRFTRTQKLKERLGTIVDGVASLHRFKINDEKTRDHIKADIIVRLISIKEEYKISRFHVVCDETNNTDDGRVYVIVYANEHGRIDSFRFDFEVGQSEEWFPSEAERDIVNLVNSLMNGSKAYARQYVHGFVRTILEGIEARHAKEIENLMGWGQEYGDYIRSETLKESNQNGVASLVNEEVGLRVSDRCLESKSLYESGVFSLKNLQRIIETAQPPIQKDNLISRMIFSTNIVNALNELNRGSNPKDRFEFYSRVSLDDSPDALLQVDIVINHFTFGRSSYRFKLISDTWVLQPNS